MHGAVEQSTNSIYGFLSLLSDLIFEDEDENGKGVRATGINNNISVQLKEKLNANMLPVVLSTYTLAIAEECRSNSLKKFNHQSKRKCDALSQEVSVSSEALQSARMKTKGALEGILAEVESHYGLELSQLHNLVAAREAELLQLKSESEPPTSPEPSVSDG
ncbi:hypothetical protein E2320_000186 [Naja naja]|nr:hypothetical protein E2320_000186 [Naja naja]